MRKMANQKKFKSQLDDLKDAIRRAKRQKGGNGSERKSGDQKPGEKKFGGKPRSEGGFGGKPRSEGGGFKGKKKPAGQGGFSKPARSSYKG